MTDRFSDALATLHLNDVSPSLSARDVACSYESSSSVDSAYTRRGQTESEADIRAGLAAARDLASRKKRYDTDTLSSSPGGRSFRRPSMSQTLESEGLEGREDAASGSKTPLPDTSAQSLTTGILGQLMSFQMVSAGRVRLHDKQSKTKTPDMRFTGKGTLARLYSTATEAKTREQRMADAIRTVLECIGEDPDRQGLLKTPERYAKALLWMTKGYEEKLSGESGTCNQSSESG